jgi:uncharacterized membrane protein
MRSNSQSREWNSPNLILGFRLPSRDFQRQVFRWLFVVTYLLQGEYIYTYIYLYVCLCIHTCILWLVFVCLVGTFKGKSSDGYLLSHTCYQVKTFTFILDRCNNIKVES